MKKLLVLAVVVVTGWTSLHYAGDYYRYEFYDWAVRFESSKARLDLKSQMLGDAQFFYLEGPKQTGQQSIVLLHGFGASKENWVRFASHLTQRYHVVALDLAGHGENPRDMSKTYGFNNQVEFVRQMVEALGIARFYLAGNSMGGAISSLYAARYPDQVLAAVLISPAGVHDIPSTMDDLLAKGENPLIAESVQDFENLLDFVMEDKPFIPAPILKVEAEKAVRRIAINHKIFDDLRTDIVRGLASQLKTIKAPVLIIWGQQDRAINVANIDRYAALIPNAQKLILQDIGHLAMLESPKFSALAMLDFISTD